MPPNTTYMGNGDKSPYYRKPVRSRNSSNYRLHTNVSNPIRNHTPSGGYDINSNGGYGRNRRHELDQNVEYTAEPADNVLPKPLRSSSFNNDNGYTTIIDQSNAYRAYGETNSYHSLNNSTNSNSHFYYNSPTNNPPARPFPSPYGNDSYHDISDDGSITSSNGGIAVSDNESKLTKSSGSSGVYTYTDNELTNRFSTRVATDSHLEYYDPKSAMHSCYPSSPAYNDNHYGYYNSDMCYSAENDTSGLPDNMFNRHTYDTAPFTLFRSYDRHYSHTSSIPHGYSLYSQPPSYQQGSPSCMAQKPVIPSFSHPSPYLNLQSIPKPPPSLYSESTSNSTYIPSISTNERKTSILNEREAGIRMKESYDKPNWSRKQRVSNHEADCIEMNNEDPGAKTVSPVVEILLNDSFYGELWKARYKIMNESEINENRQEIEERNDNVELIIKKCIKYKKHCMINKARLLFLHLLLVRYSLPQVWVEFGRMEMEAGEYECAYTLLSASLHLFPRNLILLSKLVKVDEKLNKQDSLQCIQSVLTSMNTQKSVKVLIEVVYAYMRTGHYEKGRRIMSSIGRSVCLYCGWVFLELIRFESHFVTIPTLMELIMEVSPYQPKHGPLWCSCMEYVEYYLCNRCICNPVNEENPVYNTVVQHALFSLMPEVIWKVWVNKTQRDSRMIMNYLYYYSRDILQKGNEYISLSSLYGSFFMNVCASMTSCPSTLMWKVYLMIGKFAVAIGFFQVAEKFMKRGYQLCPSKSRHSVLLDYSRVEYFLNHKRESTLLLFKGMKEFPDEWKLSLERIKHLVFDDCTVEALHLCDHVIRFHTGAGRLWALYIHIIHELCGPVEAFGFFRIALHHVAKSGEVWCEGARLFLNPSSVFFSPKNASIALNFSIFFTPQYGDSYIEALRLKMLISQQFLYCHNCTSIPLLVFMMVSEPSINSFIDHISLFDPNYGPLWYRCKDNDLSSAKEILYKSVWLNAVSIATNAAAYYEAIRSCCTSKNTPNCSFGCHSDGIVPKLFTHRKEFSYAFMSDYDFAKGLNQSCLHPRVKTLYGSVHIEN